MKKGALREKRIAKEVIASSRRNTSLRLSMLMFFMLLSAGWSDVASSNAGCASQGQGGNWICVPFEYGAWGWYSMYSGYFSTAAEFSTATDAYNALVSLTASRMKQANCTYTVTALSAITSNTIDTVENATFTMSYGGAYCGYGTGSDPGYITGVRQRSCPQGTIYHECGAPPEMVITLTGGSSTEPWNKKHDPNHVVANLPFVAIVTDQNGQPKAGINVTISTDVTPYTGGHNHNDGRPKGKLIATPGNPVSAVSTVNGGAAISGTTDSGGIFWFTFGTEEASGEHTITANCTDCKAPATSTVKVEIPNLMKLGDDNTCTTSYCLRGGLTPHPGNHYYTGAAEYHVVQLANAYVEEYGEPLQINDSSLIKGGLYDIHLNWNSSHKGHRKGTVVDVNNFFARDKDFEQFVADHQAIAKWEEDPPHYHLRLLKRDE